MSGDQSQTPYADAIAAFAAAHPVRYHLPGHAGTTAGGSALADWLGGAAADLDIMPMVEGIDLGPGNAFDAATALAAEAWGARRTWFLTNGATQGNVIAVLAAAGAGDVFVATRSVHSSVIDGLALAGAAARFVAPVIDHEHGVAHAVTAAAIGSELAACAERAERVAAVIVVSPTYFGFVADIERIADVCHRHGVPLIVDEAWGAHLGFHPLLPRRALSFGADLVVSSTHKLGGSLTQSAMLHLGDGPFADQLEARIDVVHRGVQSTSESSLLLASLDLARHGLVNGTARIGASIDAARRLADAVRAGGRFELLSDHFGEFDGWAGTDPLRVVVDTRGAGVDGRALRAELLRRHGLLVELATEGCLVAVIGAGAVPDVDALPPALERAAATAELAHDDAVRLPAWGRAVTSIRAAWLAPSEVVGHRQAIGRVSAASLAAYPPGIPNLLPGEEVTAEVVEFLRRVAASPAGLVRGAADPAVDTIRVVTD